MDMKLEVLFIPISDVDRAKHFYEKLGFRLDIDIANEDFRGIQFTPPGSEASIIFGKGITSAQPGSIDRPVLAVYDIDAARNDLIARGVNVSEVFHYAGGPFNNTVENPRVSGRDPQGRSYYSFASFEDPDGNEWLLQEIKTRLPGREWNLTRPQAIDVALPSGSQYNDIRAQWYSRIFNSVNWLSFMINEKVINDKKMIEHMKPVIISYYENMFLKNASADERDTEF